MTWLKILVMQKSEVMYKNTKRNMPRWKGKCNKKIARVRNCPDVTMLNSIFGLLSFCFFVFLSCCLFDFLSFCLVALLLSCIRIWRWNLQFIRPYILHWKFSNGRTSETKKATGDPLVTKFSYRQGISPHSFMKVTSRHSFTLFRLLFWKKPLFLVSVFVRK